MGKVVSEHYGLPYADKCVEVWIEHIKHTEYSIELKDLEGFKIVGLSDLCLIKVYKEIGRMLYIDGHTIEGWR